MQLKLASIILCIVLNCNAASVHQLYPTEGSVKAVLKQTTSNATSEITPMALNGWTDCGVAQIVDINLPGCNSAPCSFSVGSSFDLTIQFRPRDFHAQMHLRAILLKDIQLHQLVDGDVADSTLQQGQLYEFNYRFSMPSAITGAAEFRLKFYQNYVHELCVVIPINIQ